MNKRAQILFWGYFTAFRKHLTDYHNLQVVSAYQIFYFLIIPIWFQKIVLLYNPIKNKYYEFDSDILEKRLLKIKDSTSNTYLNTIKEYEKERKEKIKFIEQHKEEIEKKENDEFIKFIKIIGGLIIILFLFMIIKWIITKITY